MTLLHGRDTCCACAGWWCFVDALVVTKAVQHEGFPFTYWLPGIVATIALVHNTEAKLGMMSLLQHE
jgi:hypothetical protein